MTLSHNTQELMRPRSLQSTSHTAFSSYLNNAALSLCYLFVLLLLLKHSYFVETRDWNSKAVCDYETNNILCQINVIYDHNELHDFILNII